MENRRKPITQESRDRKRAQLMKRRKKIMRTHQKDKYELAFFYMVKI